MHMLQTSCCVLIVALSVLGCAYPVEPIGGYAYAPAPYYAAPVVYAPPVQVIPMHPRGHRHRHHDHHGPRGYWRGY